MRIIGGEYRSRRFDVPANFKLRPTTDFAKENLFNVLNNLIDFEETSALDLFSGTGSISLELASRGCKEVISVEKENAHYNFICQCAKVLSAPIYPLKGDALKYLSSHNGPQYDLIFADPPYDLKELEQIPAMVFDNHRLKPGGLFILEHSSKNNFKSHPFFMQQREYGSVNFTFFLLPEQS